MERLSNEYIDPKKEMEERKRGRGNCLSNAMIYNNSGDRMGMMG
jgi:hypothetical protein